MPMTSWNKGNSTNDKEISDLLNEINAISKHEWICNDDVLYCNRLFRKKKSISIYTLKVEGRNEYQILTSAGNTRDTIIAFLYGYLNGTMNNCGD